MTGDQARHDQGAETSLSANDPILDTLALVNITAPAQGAVVSGDTLPTTGQEIEVIVQYDGPVTKDWHYRTCCVESSATLPQISWVELPQLKGSARRPDVCFAINDK